MRQWIVIFTSLAQAQHSCSAPFSRVIATPKACIGQLQKPRQKSWHTFSEDPEGILLWSGALLALCHWTAEIASAGVIPTPSIVLGGRCVVYVMSIFLCSSVCNVGISGKKTIIAPLLSQSLMSFHALLDEEPLLLDHITATNLAVEGPKSSVVISLHSLLEAATQAWFKILWNNLCFIKKFLLSSDPPCPHPVAIGRCDLASKYCPLWRPPHPRVSTNPLERDQCIFNSLNRVHDQHVSILNGLCILNLSTLQILSNVRHKVRGSFLPPYFAPVSCPTDLRPVAMHWPIERWTGPQTILWTHPTCRIASSLYVLKQIANHQWYPVVI